MSVWHVEESRCTQVKCTPPANWTSVVQRPYCTRSVSHVEECRCTQVRCNSPTLHSIEPQWLQSPTTPCQFDIWKNADVPRSDVHPQLIEPNTPTELYYTMSVWYVEEYRCTQVRQYTPHSLNLVVQNPTILCQFDMSKNAGVPRSNVHSPLLIEPSATELVLHHVSLICGQNADVN